MKNTVQCEVKLLMQENLPFLDILSTRPAVYLSFTLSLTFIYSPEPRKLTLLGFFECNVYSLIHSLIHCLPRISKASRHRGDKDEQCSAPFFKGLIITLALYPHQVTWPSSSSFWLSSSILTDIFSLKETIAFVFLTSLSCGFLLGKNYASSFL